MTLLSVFPVQPFGQENSSTGFLACTKRAEIETPEEYKPCQKKKIISLSTDLL